MDEVTITKLINGPEAFTPDNEFCLGETEVGGLFVAAGFCAHGLAGAGGIGKVMAEWIDRGRADHGPVAHGHPPLRRAVPLARLHRTPASSETYETYYDIRYPNHERQAGRPLRVTPANAWHASTTRPSARSPAGSGSTGTSRTRPAATSRCARAAGPASTGRPRSAPSTWRRARAPGSSTRARSRSWRSSGPGAAALVERLCDNRVAREPGKITYTQMLNSRGGIECDFTVARLAEERFSIVTGTAFGNHDREWIRRHLGRDGESDGAAASRSTTSPRSAPASASGARRPARCCSRSPPRTSATRPSPT